MTSGSTRDAALLFAGLSCLYLVTLSGHYGGDGFLSYLTAESLVLDRDVAILDRPFHVPEMAKGARATAPVGRDGRRYSEYGLGLPAAEVPFYAAGLALARAAPFLPSDYITMGAVSTLNAFVTATIATLLFAAGRGAGVRGLAALVGPLAFGLGSFAWGNSRLGFAEPLLCLCLFAAFLLIRAAGSGSGRGRAVLAGVLVGLAIHVKLYSVVLVPLFVTLLATGPPDRVVRSRRIVGFLIPIAAAALLLAAANTARFGRPLLTGYRVEGGAFS